MRLLLVIAFLLALFSAASAIEPYERGDGNVLEDNVCVVYCSVQSSTKTALINPPHVKWERLDNFNFNDHQFVDLIKTFYWYDSHDVLYSDVPTSCTYRADSAGVYDCDLVIKHCTDSYYGTYRCSVDDFDTGTQVSRNITFSFAGFHDFAPGCVEPEVILNVALVEDENGTSHANFSWDYVALPENETNCPHVLSVRNFNSAVVYDFEDREEPLGRHYTSQRYIQIDTSNGQNYHLFTGIDKRRYYQFELRLQVNLGTSSHNTYSRFSYVHYFSVQRAASIVLPTQPHTIIRATVGHRVDFPCAGTGIPSPSVMLLRDVDSATPSLCAGCVIDLNVITHVREADAGQYFCLASNTLVNPPLGKRTLRDWKSIQLIVETETLPTNMSHCDYYTGDTCGAYIDKSEMVFIDGVSGDGDIDSLQQQVSKLFQKIERHDNRSVVDSALKTKCSKLAQSIACHSSFPYCHPNMTTPTPRPVCKSTCDEFAVGGACYSYLNAVDTPELYSRLMFNCDSRETPGGTEPECIPISSETAETGHYAAIDHSWCSGGNGRNYAGTIQRTKSGRDCQAWSSQSPHSHPFYPTLYPTELLASRFYCRNPGGVGEGPWCYTSDPNVRWEYCDVPQCDICESYRGSFCADIPGYSDDNVTVYVNRSATRWGPGAQGSVETYLMSKYEDLHPLVDNVTWTPGCDYALKELLCHTTLPFCKNQDEAAPLSVCSDQCKLLDTIHFCSASVFSHLVQMMYAESSSFKFFLLPGDCTAVTDDSFSTGTDCMPPPSGLALQSESTGDCYDPVNRGHGYSGPVAMTQKGVACESWNNTHILFHDDLYPELNNSGNSCRNPGQLKERPWCFISQNRWDYCPLPPNCTQDTTTPAPASGVNTTTVGFSVGIVVVLLVAVLACLILVLYIVKHCRQRHYRRNSSPPPQLRSMSKVPAEMKMVENGNYVTQDIVSTRMRAVMNRFEGLDHQIDRDDVRYVRQIGQGNFGVVFMGKMYDNSDNDREEMIVAVKTLKDECLEAMEDFAREARIMLQLDHPNIIKLYGVCADKVPYYLVFEYMDQGDLSKFIKQHASSRQRRLMDPMSDRRSRTESTLSDDPPSLSQDQLSDICKQVAAGMQYLAERNHVHRDLACRNCLVKSPPKEDLEETNVKYIVKIGDFGLSHDLYQRNYFRVQGNAILPIRWMSPEALIFGKFSTAGDVWSFGVTMWEVFSFAMQPYYGHSNEEVTKLIRSGGYLERPVDCPQRIYEIMHLCWNMDPDQRPSFKDLQDKINEFRSSLSSESNGSPTQGRHSPATSLINEEEEEEDSVFLDNGPPPQQGHAHLINRLEHRFAGNTPPQQVAVATRIPDGTTSPYERDRHQLIGQYPESSPSTSSTGSNTSAEESHL